MERHGHGNESARTDAVDAEEVRSLVNRWGREQFFRVKGWGDKIAVTSIRHLPSYILTLDTQYERRTAELRRVPYDGGPTDSLHPPPDLWEVEAPAPADFATKRMEGVVVPHTEAVVPCEGCHGHGWTDCASCKGTGYLLPGAKGEKRCPACSGTGSLLHTACSGKGKFRQFSVLTAEFTCKSVKENLFAVPLPDRLLEEAGRETLIDHRRKGGGFITDDLHPEMEPSLEELWKQSVPKDRDTTRILFQRYRVERVKGWEVHYDSPPHADQKLWIVGEGKRVYAPHAPRAWGRIAAASVPAAALAAALIVLLLPMLAGVFGSGRPQTVQVTQASSGEAGGRSPGTMRGPSGGAAAGTKSGASAAGGVGAGATGAELLAEGGADTGPGGTAAAPAPQVTVTEEDLLDDTDETSEDDLLGSMIGTEETPLDTYDVLAGIYNDAETAREVAQLVEEAAYEPTTTSTSAPDRLYIVSIKGFYTRESAQDAIQELSRRGINARLRVVPDTPEPVNVATRSARTQATPAPRSASRPPAASPPAVQAEPPVMDPDGDVTTDDDGDAPDADMNEDDDPDLALPISDDGGGEP